MRLESGWEAAYAHRQCDGSFPRFQLSLLPVLDYEWTSALKLLGP